MEPVWIFPKDPYAISTPGYIAFMELRDAGMEFDAYCERMAMKNKSKQKTNTKKSSAKPKPKPVRKGGRY